MFYYLFKYFSQLTDRIKIDNNVDLTEDIQLLLKCVQVLEGRFGLVVAVNFICGKKNDKFSKHLMTNKLFGMGTYNTDTFWKSLGKLITNIV